MASEDSKFYPYYDEYMFHMALNRSIDIDGLNIKVSHGRLLRDSVNAYALENFGQSMDSGRLNSVDFCQSYDAVMTEAFGDRFTPLFSDPQKVDRFRRVMTNNFKIMTGIASVPNSAYKSSEMLGSSRNLPVSPYDPRWRNRSSIRSLGHELGRIQIDEINDRLGGNLDYLLIDDGSSAGVVGGDDLMVYRVVDTDGSYREVGPVVTDYDVSGMTVLMPYIESNRFADLAEWLMQPAKEANGRINKNKIMDQGTFEKTLAILEDLDSQGVEYTIEKDRYPGQLKARIKGSNLDIRLTDTKGNERYVGRCYQNGTITRFKTDRKIDQSHHFEYEASIEEILDMIHVAQGKTVEVDGKHLGTDGFWRSASFTMPYKTVTDALGTMNVSISVDRDKYTEPLRFMKDAEAAEEFLRNAIATAHTNVESMVDIVGLRKQFNENREAALDGTFVPMFNGNTEIAAIQQAYWDVMRDEDITSVIPGINPEMYTGVASRMGDPEINEFILSNMIGRYEPSMREDANGDMKMLSFDPVRVSIFMDSDRNQLSNIDDLINAMKIVGTDVNTLAGDNYQTRIVLDRMVEFDEDNARRFVLNEGIEGEDGPNASVQSRAMNTLWNALAERGHFVTDMAIDDKGVIRYKGIRNFRVRDTTTPEEFTGYMGQIFEPGQKGTITTQFASGENYLFAPGYEAIILKQKLGEELSVEERTRLRGYEQLLTDEIRNRVVSDTYSKQSTLGSTSSVNRVYRRLYDTRHDVDFFNLSAEQGLDPRWRDAILETESRIVRYPNSVRDDSTINAAHNAKIRDIDLNNDSWNDPWVLTDGRNMSIMTEEGDGYFDPMMTSSGTNQGITRYLVESAEVTPDGRIIQGDINDRAPLAKLPEVANMKFNPFDRQQMSYSNLLRAESITEPVKTAMMTMGAWNADDPLIISERFAKSHQIRNKAGELRDLKIGDKLSDFHGNKGVISMVISPDMDPFDPKNAGLEKMIGIFADNPELDVVMSPFSAVSRFNGGTARDLMSDPSELDLTSVGNSYIDGGMGSMRFIVTSMAVDSKTRIYGDDDLAQGRGRKASSQLAWALGAQDCEAVLGEMYGYNERSIADLKEYLITMGLDISPTGDLRYGFDDFTADMEGESRALYSLPAVTTETGRETLLNLRKQFTSTIGEKGGDLLIPFPLTMPTGEKLRRGENDENGNPQWVLPIISSHLRRGQELNDGAIISHDYTAQYNTIYSKAVSYKFYKDRLDKNEGTERDRAKWELSLQDSIAKSQSAYNKITSDIERRRFSGKHNIFKNSIMSSRLPNSATSVWSSDPRLALDEVAMSSSMADQLGFSHVDDYALIWRDPILRDGGVRYLKVVINDDLTGVAINPAMDACFDGDFDGDSVAVVRLQSKAAQREAREKLTVEANLLDLGSWREDDAEYDLYLQDSLDTKVSQHRNPDLKERFADLRRRANDAWTDYQESDNKVVARYSLLSESKAIVSELTDYYRDAWEDEYGSAVLQFNDIESHMQSVIESCVDTGAKGSLSKIVSYGRYIGAIPTSELELGQPRTFEDAQQPQVSREDHTGVETATAIKSFGTGVAGKFSQRGVRLMRNHGLKAVLELTYPVTQSILQAKHDPEEALVKYQALMGPARDLWRGRKLERNVVGEDVMWTPVREQGEYVMATRDEWVDQFIDIYTHPKGLGVSVNKDFIEEVADHMSDNGIMMGVEIDADDLNFETTLASPMDVLAYDGDFSMVVRAAKAGVNLYSGKRNSYFEPKMIKRNKEREASILNNYEAGLPTDVDLDDGMERIGAADVRSDYVNRRRYTSRLASSVRESVSSVPLDCSKLNAPEPQSNFDDSGFDL